MSDQKKEIALFGETLSLSFTDHGEGRPYLILHGGAGPASASGLAESLAQNGRAITPTHPGFNNEPRPEWFARVNDLVLAYLALLDHLNLSNVIVVGNSFGGWIAAEMALRHSARITGIVLLNAVGIDTGSPDKKIVDPMAVAPAERAALSFHNPQRFGFTPTGPQLAIIAENQRTLRVYAGESMYDSTLTSRLARISLPAVVLWGASDHIVGVDYGKRWAAHIPNASFKLVREAGHFPQIERLDEVLGLIGDFAKP